jgi:hypothetical protein
MPTGRRFALNKETMAVEIVDQKRVAHTIPADDIVQVTSLSLERGPMTDVLWNGRLVSMFTVDLLERGEEVFETAAV